MPNRKSTNANGARKGAGRPRARAALRVVRYQTWEELHEATLALCRKEIRSGNPGFDVATCEHDARRRAPSFQSPVSGSARRI